MREAAGLNPQRCICVGRGYSREEIKQLFFDQGLSLISTAVTTSVDLAFRVAGSSKLASPAVRRELLRQLLGGAQARAMFAEISSKRRKRSFFSALDRTLQSARKSFASIEEEIAIDEFLASRGKSSPTRAELRKLAVGFEANLERLGLMDEPMVFRAAIETLRTGRLVQTAGDANDELPKALTLYTAGALEGCEELFFSELCHVTKIERVTPRMLARDETNAKKVTWLRFHTLDDAAGFLARENIKLAKACAALMPDELSVRRSLTLALQREGLELEDPRDPTRLRWDEGVKYALLPLELVARRFERDHVIEWIEKRGLPPAWINEIFMRGIHMGLPRYQGGTLEMLHAELASLQAEFGGRATASELARKHLARLEGENARFFEALWENLVDAVLICGVGARLAPVLYWLEHLREQIEVAKPEVSRIRLAGGLRVYRLEQAPARAVESGPLFVLGLPPDWFGGESRGDYWYTAAEREMLSDEFGVYSGTTRRKDRLAILGEWLRSANDIVFLDAKYDWDGRERESLGMALNELLGYEPSVEERSGFGQWNASFSFISNAQPEIVRLGVANTDVSVSIDATTLDWMSRCGFCALATSRWKTRDQRESDLDLWPEVKGQLLHRAVEYLVRARLPDGGFGMSARDALEEAWRVRPPRGLVSSVRLTEHIKKRLGRVLDRFMEQEREYMTRSGALVLSLERDTRLELKVGGVRITGIPDRIDEHPDGLVVIDYKSSTSLPTGTDMLVLGYRLQLPFYALAAASRYAKPVIAAQFIELTPTGGRSHGIFLNKYNGKNAGCITNLRSNSKSLFSEEPEVLWSKALAQIENTVSKYRAGVFEARPIKSGECFNCPFRGVCGKDRRAE